MNKPSLSTLKQTGIASLKENWQADLRSGFLVAGGSYFICSFADSTFPSRVPGTHTRNDYRGARPTVLLFSHRARVINPERMVRLTTAVRPW